MKPVPIKILLLPLALAGCTTPPPAAPEGPLVPYLCMGDYTTITADYYALKNPRVILKYGETTTTLPATATHPGESRYATGTKPGSLVWWIKNPDAMLYQVTATENGYTYEKQLASCLNSPNPLAAPPMRPVPDATPLTGSIPGTAPGFMYAPLPAAPAK